MNIHYGKSLSTDSNRNEQQRAATHSAAVAGDSAAYVWTAL